MTDATLWVDAYIGLGSNLDNPIANIASARAAIAHLDAVEGVAFSPLYQTQPVGPQDQPDYVNAVMRVRTLLAPQALLSALQQIENDHGRKRLLRWGARTLDLDILLYGQCLIDSPHLQVPHPEMAHRAFVLYPLSDVANDTLAIPGVGVLGALLSACPADGVARLAP
jgi:2-amino-4-hydroxy-6-hydroxymethyldihydropteridine diphosphokinase